MKALNFVTAALLLCSIPAISATAAKPKPSPVYTQEQATGYVKELVPIVESTSGRKFKKVPACLIVTPAQVEPVLKAELLNQLKWKHDTADAASQAQVSASILSSSALGKYGTGRKVLYLLPGNLARRIKTTNIDPKHAQSIIKLIIAHELTHALQDQEIGLARLFLLPSTTDEMSATNAAIEGHAMFVTDRIADTLQIQEADKEIARTLAAGIVNSDDPADKLTASYIQNYFRQIYIKGRDYMAWQYEKGGNDLLWKILAHPPKTTVSILSPGPYTAPIETKAAVDYEKVLKGLETHFGTQKWTVFNKEVGAMSIGAVYANMEPGVRDKVVANLEHIQSLAALNGPVLATVSVFVFRDSSLTSDYISALNSMTRANVKVLEGSKKVKISDCVIKGFTGMASDASSKMFLKAIAGKDSSSSTYVRVARGRVVIEIFVSDTQFADKQFADIAETVFKRLPADMTQKQ